MPKCPKCGEELIEVGYPDEFGFQEYKCPNGCEIETLLHRKVMNNIYVALLLISLSILLIFAFLGRALSKILRKD